jgi:hypothetical protein
MPGDFMAVRISRAKGEHNGLVLNPQRLLPRFLYVWVRVPVVPVPIFLFIPTLALEGLAYLAGWVARRWSREAAYYLEQARVGLRLIRHQGAFTLVELEVQDVARFSGGFSGPVRVRVGQC